MLLDIDMKKISLELRENTA